jgi:hypothetical protein
VTSTPPGGLIIGRSHLPPSARTPVVPPYSPLERFERSFPTDALTASLRLPAVDTGRRETTPPLERVCYSTQPSVDRCVACSSFPSLPRPWQSRVPVAMSPPADSIISRRAKQYNVRVLVVDRLTSALSSHQPLRRTLPHTLRMALFSVRTAAHDQLFRQLGSWCRAISCPPLMRIRNQIDLSLTNVATFIRHSQLGA